MDGYSPITNSAPVEASAFTDPTFGAASGDVGAGQTFRTMEDLPPEVKKAMTEGCMQQFCMRQQRSRDNIKKINRENRT